ncbi:TetR/AcrR family transcriptional regulator [Streptomyces sp. NBC_01334]|uniref:TetR/AcrR family transcriptional regulator n=1 Tax=Streptomyces sp. NBC_01334 TaxID=2903827 RepID=UPI002E1178C8|nr:helix-turn-helix domain-containing protein [Streptomyces sp. NBC_01334]
MAGLRAAQKEMTRRLLLSTALELFEARGYPGTTVDDIAKAAGTTRVTFYAYFPSRVALMKALVAELDELLERGSPAEPGPAAPALAAVVRAGERAGFEAWLRENSRRWPRIRPYVLAAHEAAAVEPELRELVDQWFDEVVSAVEAGLEQAGRFDPGSRRLRGFLALTQLDQLARRWMRHGWETDPATALGLLADSWQFLLGEPHGGPAGPPPRGTA